MPYLDISTALQIMFSPLSDQKSISYITESRPSSIAEDSSYSRFYQNSTLPFFFGIDTRVFYKFIGGGLTYYRMNALNIQARIGQSDAAADENNPANFEGFKNISSYQLTGSGSAIALEFFLRKFIATEELYLLLSLGYLNQQLRLKYNFNPSATLAEQPYQQSLDITSHGAINRLEINFARGYFIYSMGIALLWQNFPTFTINDTNSSRSSRNSIQLEKTQAMFYFRIGLTY